MLSIIATGAIAWSTATYQLRDKIVDLGCSKTFATQLINECKKGKQDAKRCVIAGTAIALNETNCGKTAYKNSLFGVKGEYETQGDSIKYWVETYNKWWYKWKDGTHFYGSSKGIAKTRYCTEEESSNTQGHCPNGRKHFDYFISKLK